MHVQVRHALADSVVHGDERPGGAEHALHRHREALRMSEEGTDGRVREVGQRLDVVGRHQEHVALEQWPPIEERKRVVVSEHQVRVGLAGRDGAEGAGRIAHRAILHVR